MEEPKVKIEVPGSGSILFARDDDGGVSVKQELLFLDGRRDHIVTTAYIKPVDARRVFEVFGRVRNSTGG